MRMRWLVTQALILAGIAYSTTPAGAAPADSTGLPFVDSIYTVPSIPCPGEPTRIVLSGRFTSGCGAKAGRDTFRMVVAVIDPNLTCRGCPEVLVQWADTLNQGHLAPGSYQAWITLAVIDPCPALPETTFFKRRFDFRVWDTCPDPVPPDDPLRYLSRVAIVSDRDPASGILCQDDSIRVLMGGHFPDDCHILRRVEVVEPLDDSVYPRPPIVRLIFDNLCCAGRPCVQTPTPWNAGVTLPPLPGGRPYDLFIEGVETCCRDYELPGDPKGSRRIPFTVVSPESCSVLQPSACLVPRWDHNQRVGECDTNFDREGNARVTLTLHTTVALSGLQGTVLTNTEPGATGLLYVSAVEAVGPAAGMRLAWEPRAGGVDFVLFAEQGAPIPSTLLTEPVPVIRVTFRQVPSVEGAFVPDPTRRWFVHANDVLGSDINGIGVSPCPYRDGRFAPDFATICVGDGCDLNGDARSDVRDLVLMARCLSGGACPPKPDTTLDCEGDHDFDLDDVLCCARVVVGGPPCPSCPADSVRQEPGIAVAFGDPVRTSVGFDIPIRIDGADRIGASRLAFRLPEGLAGARVSGGNSGWLVLDQRDGANLKLGMIALGPVPAGSSRLVLMLHADLASGASASGSVSLSEAEFSGPDGVMLASDIGSPVVRLGPGVGLALSPARPNPFDGQTEFRLTLDAAADVELGIYDLAGRQVAVLHRGRLPVGVHPFTWNGREDGGSRVPAGVYFARAGAAGVHSVRKLVLVGGD